MADENLQVSSTSSEPPKRFVRTFSRDAAALKEGGVPDFIELENAPESPPVDVPRPAIPPEGIKIPVAVSATSPSERLIEETPLPPPPPPPPLPPLKKPEDEAPIRTYTSDFSTELQKESASTASVLAAEGDRETRTSPPSSRSSLPLVLGGIALVVVGGAGAYFAYAYRNSTPPPPAPTSTVASPIFVNDREELTGTGQTLETAIEQSLKKPLAANSVRLLYTAQSTEQGQDVFHALQVPAPDILLRNIVANGSVAGIVHVGDTMTPFFILAVSSYGDTFAGMLQWETHMATDLGTLYPGGEQVLPSATSTGPLPSKFKDEVVASHDVRALRDINGTSVIMYGYWNPQTLVIAKNEQSFAEIIGRLSTSRTQK